MKDRIRAIMDSKGMTQQEFSQFLEMSPASLSSIYTGRTNPTLNVVELIKKKFENINLEWLMFGTGTMFKDVAPTDPDTTDSDELYDKNVVDSSKILDSEAPSTHMYEKNISDHSQAGCSTCNTNNAVSTSSQPLMYDLKYIDKPTRKIKEIRVFYDDQTYESFVPKE